MTDQPAPALRIALVYRSFHLSGSLPRATVELARHLSHRHDVHVYSAASRTDTSLAPDCTFHNVPVDVRDRDRFSARELSSFARKAANLLSRERFDLVHTCAPSTWVSDVLHLPGLAREEARLQGIPSWKYAASAVRHPGDATRRLLERKALRYPGLRRVHVAAPSMLEQLSSRYGIAREDVLLVPPGVNLGEFQPPADKAAARAAADVNEPDTTVLLFCGSDFERKGLDRAIRALAQVRTTAMLLVVGGGDAGPYRKLAAKLGVSKRVRFLGTRNDAWRVFQAADIVLLPTRADVWGVTPIEAMACGVPPIVSLAAGSSGAIRNGGIVLGEPFNVRALRDAIDALAADDALRARLGAAGVELAKQHSWTEGFRRVEQDLLAVHRRARRPTDPSTARDLEQHPLARGHG